MTMKLFIFNESTPHTHTHHDIPIPTPAPAPVLGDTIANYYWKRPESLVSEYQHVRTELLGQDLRMETVQIQKPFR